MNDLRHVLKKTIILTKHKKHRTNLQAYKHKTCTSVKTKQIMNDLRHVL